MKKTSVNTEALQLLAKYRAGQCSPHEIERVERWFNSFDDNNENLTEADKVAIEEVTQNILLKTQPGQPKVLRFKPIYRWYAAAACLLLGLITVSVLMRRSASRAELEQNLSFSTTNGQRKTITLADGSMVMLNAASSVKLLGFDSEHRTIALSGEAFFKIAKDKAHPFIIKTGKIQTHVIGTSFNIRAYADEPNISVAVASGKVQVEENNVGVKVLGAGMTVNHLFTYNIKSGSYTLVENNVNTAKGWINNQLYFNKATLADIARIMERTYNVPVKLIGQAKTNPHFTATFSVSNIDATLSQLSLLTGVSYQRTANGIVLDLDSIK